MGTLSHKRVMAVLVVEDELCTGTLLWNGCERRNMKIPGEESYKSL